MTPPESPDLPEPGLVFNILDYRGRMVRLTRRTYEAHQPIHLDVSEYLEEAQRVIVDPDGVIELESGAVELYREGLGRDPYASCYLGVIIHYRGAPGFEEGIVATFFFQQRLPRGLASEIRYQWVSGTRTPIIA